MEKEFMLGTLTGFIITIFLVGFVIWQFFKRLGEK